MAAFTHHRLNQTRPMRLFLCSYALAGARSFAFPLSAVRSAAGGVVPQGLVSASSCCDAAAKGKVKLARDSSCLAQRRECAFPVCRTRCRDPELKLQYQLKRLVEEAVPLDAAHRRCFLRLHTVSSTEEHDGSIAATHAGLLPDTASDGSEEGGERIPARNGERTATRRRRGWADTHARRRSKHSTFATVSFDSRHDTVRPRSGLRSHALLARVTCPLPPPPPRLLRTPQGSSPRLLHRENRTPRL